MKMLFLIFAFQLVSAEEFHDEEARNDLSNVVRDLLKKVREHEKIFAQQSQMISTLKSEAAQQSQMISTLKSEAAQQSQMISTLKSEAAQQSQMISTLKSEVDTMKKKMETCCPTKKKEIPSGKTKENPVKSCKWLQENNKDFKSGLYWISLKESTQVYCDMSKKYGGGWTLIGKATVKSKADEKEVDYQKLLSNSISDLRLAQSNRFLLSSRGLKELQSYIGFTQIRFYCYKPWHGRTVHIHTLENNLGQNVIDLMTERRKEGPQSCASYARLQDDDSNIGRYCERWNLGKWYDRGVDNVKMYYFPFFINDEHHFSLYPGRLECDDWAYHGDPAFSSIGEWAFYVR